jgi:hypothetical protein
MLDAWLCSQHCKPCKLVSVPSPCLSSWCSMLNSNAWCLMLPTLIHCNPVNLSLFHHLAHPFNSQHLNASSMLVPSQHPWMDMVLVSSVNACHPRQADRIHSQWSQLPTCSKLRSIRSTTSQADNFTMCKLDRKWKICLYCTPNTGTSWGLLGWDRIFALYLAVTLAVPSFFHPAPNSCQQLPNRMFSPHWCPMLDAWHWNAWQLTLGTQHWNAQLA